MSDAFIRRLECVFVAATNFYGVYAVNKRIRDGKSTEAIVTSISIISSFIYHLAKHSTNNMSGFSALRNYENILHKLDLGFAISTALICGYNNPQTLYRSISNKPKIITAFCNILDINSWGNDTDNDIIRLIPLSFISLALGELGHIFNLTPKQDRTCYIIFHSIWHILAFHTAYLF